MRNRLRDLRTAQGETQEQLAAAVDVSRQTINAVETGRYTPSLLLAFHLASRYHTTIEEMFDHDASCQPCPLAPEVPAAELPPPAPPA